MAAKKEKSKERLKDEKEREKFVKKLGAQIRKFRKEKGFSLREADANGDFDRHILSKIENGKLNPGVYSVKKICDILGISMEELFRGL
jgi:transcriptional regulator with XRE-family HTH domain